MIHHGNSTVIIHNQHYLRNCLATATSEVAATARRAGGRVRRLFGAGHSDASDQRCMLAWSDGERGGACGPLQAPPPLNGNGVGALVMDIIPADLLGSADGRMACEPGARRWRG